MLYPVASTIELSKLAKEENGKYLTNALNTRQSDAVFMQLITSDAVKDLLIAYRYTVKLCVVFLSQFTKHSTQELFIIVVYLAYASLVLYIYSLVYVMVQAGVMSP